MRANKKRIIAAVVMIIMIAVSIIMGGYISLTNKYYQIKNAYRTNSSEFEQMAIDYDNTLNMFPANLLNKIACVPTSDEIRQQQK